MATVNAINSHGKGGGGLRGSLRYVSQDKKALLLEKQRQETERRLESARKLVSGVNCSPDTAYTEFMTTKRSFGKTDGRQFYHFVQSFHPDEAVTPEQVHQIGLEFAEKSFPGFEVVVATHMDADHLHSHLIVNSVSFETGKKLHQSAEDLRQHRAVSDEICLAHGLFVLPPVPKPSAAKSLRSREYRAAVKGDSWKFRLMNAIDHAMSRSRTRREFIENMRRMEYGVTWSDTRKHITYACPNGKKCRDNRLHEPKYLKETMQREFQYREIERTEPAGIALAGQAVSTGDLRHTVGAVGGHDEAARGEPTLAPVDGGAGTEQRQRRKPQREVGEDSVLADAQPWRDRENAVGDGTTGWEGSRQSLAEFEEAGGRIPPGNQQPVAEAAPGMAGVGLSLAGDLAGLARNLGEMSGKSEQTPKPKAVHERKRGIGQKEDDHEQEQGYELSM